MRGRLQRRGTVVSSAALALLLAENAASAAVSLSLLDSTLKAAARFAADSTGAERARHGQLPDPPPEAEPGDRVKVLDPAGALVALAEVTVERSGRRRLRSLRVFAPEE